jgi:hypothetical protein
MSWYLFKDAPAVQQRGKKIDGFSCNQFTNIVVPKPKVNLSWGMNEPADSRPTSNYSSLNKQNSPNDTLPASFQPTP